MKKLFLLFILCFVFLTGCNGAASREIGTTSNFSSVGTKNGFTVSDNLSSYPGVDYIKESYQLTLDDAVIEMVVYDNEETAGKAQEKQIEAFLQIKSSGATIKKETGSNYYKYVMISNGYYMVSSKVENTLIFSKTLLKNKDKVENILEEMGY